MEFTAKQIAQIIKGTVDGDESAIVTKFSKIEHGKPGSLCFFANPKYEQYVYTSKASVIIVNNDFVPKEKTNVTFVRVQDAYTAIAELLNYVSHKKRKTGRHRSLFARWYRTTKFGKGVYAEPTGDGYSNTLTTFSMDNYVWDRNFKVRELTDRESFRLMDVNPEDTEKLLKVIPSKYCKKLSGNSIVVNVMTELFRNLFDERKNPEIPLF